MTDQRIAILVDCDNANPAVLDYAMQCATACGRVVLKRAYGNHTTLANRWKESLVQMAFAPCLQFQHVAGKNTSDIALALDALEALLDKRADSFVIVTSDSDFVYLCHKLRERGAGIHVVGEAKTPEALRSACDQFFEFVPVEPATETPERRPDPPVQLKAVQVAAPPTKQLPQFVLEVLAQLAGDAPGGKVNLSLLGTHLHKRKGGFKAKTYGYPTLIELLRAYPSLKLSGKEDKNCSVGFVRKPVDQAA